jgi:oxygen-independent coproporphyrinogen-3 oxidase
MESAHNMNYWADGGYIGIGPSAWSYVLGARSQNAPALDDYARLSRGGSAAVFSEALEGERGARQAAVLALRTRRGIIWDEFEGRCGRDFAEAIRKDLAAFPGDVVENFPGGTRLTPKGMRLGNAVWSGII